MKDLQLAASVLKEQGYDATVTTARKYGEDVPCVQIKAEGNMAPLIYQSTIDDMNEDELIAFVAKTLENTPDVDMSDIFTKTYFLDHAVSCVRHITEDDQIVKYPVMGDLEEYFRVVLEENYGDGRASIVVRPEQIESLGITPDELREAARKNLSEEVEIKPMSSVLSEMMGTDPESLGIDNMMFVASTKSRMEGAAVILLKDILDDFCQRYNIESLAIIPSSINELIIMDRQFCDDDETLNSIIQEVNYTQVDPHERLSDHYYAYTPCAAEVA